MKNCIAMTLCLAVVATAGGLIGCSKPIIPDPRLDETHHFRVNWPLKATTLEAAVKEVEANIGPGLKRPNGMVEWTALIDEKHCARIQLKDNGGKLDADSVQLLAAHPDFAGCASGK